MSSFTLAVLGPLKGQASIDLHEMMSMDAYPHTPIRASSVTK